MKFLDPFKIKINALNGQRFADIPDIQRNVTILLRGISENGFKTVSGSSTIVSRNA
jgi:hypothetical protein